MRAEKISLMIHSICKEKGINYSSVNPEVVSLYEDAQKLGKLYLALKEIIGLVKDIEDRHKVKGLKKKFEEIIQELDTADHAVIKLARELKDKQND